MTALRWAAIFRHLGHSAVVLTDYTRQQCDLLVALHAVKTRPAIVRYRERHPTEPLFVVLTGTDVFGEPAVTLQAEQSMAQADRIIALQAAMKSVIPKSLRSRLRVIYQSASLPAKPLTPPPGVFQVCVLGHLRCVKDPFLASTAARRLPETSQVKILHIGGAIEANFEERAEAEMKINPRYEWIGEQPRPKALRYLAGSHLLAMTSRAEGGPSAVSEALVAGVPVISTRVAGVIGLLGERYPGLIDIGDEVGLAEMISECETNPKFLRSLQKACERRRHFVEPEHEIQTWKSLLAEYGW